MIGLTSAHSYYLCKGMIDMRKSFDGLCGLVTNYMSMNPLDGSVYLFINKRKNKMKLLVWEHGGFMLYITQKKK